MRKIKHSDESGHYEQELERELFLEDFRKEWAAEIKQHAETNVTKSNTFQASSSSAQQRSGDHVVPESSVMEEALEYFEKAVALEQAGMAKDSLPYYRKAFQIVPDIDRKVEWTRRQRKNDSQKASGSKGAKVESSEMELQTVVPETDYHSGSVLIEAFERMSVAENGPITVQPARPTSKTHIGQLPDEIISRILRYALDSNVDTRTLDVCAQVCRKWYLIARDPELWKAACVHIWGPNGAHDPRYNKEWRRMFVDRPRVRLDGVYIGKSEYTRHGEKTIDNYHPLHHVEYFRYLRFLPRNKVVYTCTPEAPQTMVTKLKRGNLPAGDQAAVYGEYFLTGDRVIIMAHKAKGKKLDPWFRPRTTHMELSIVSGKTRRNYRLQWEMYKIQNFNHDGSTEETEFGTQFGTGFEDMIFSKVKSYALL
eukprot:Clim_evm18s237 gene=Clim_evmTU18s237